MTVQSPVEPPPVQVAERPAETHAPPVRHAPHTRRLLEAPVVPMLLAMAWPNILIMLAQASTGLIETWWIAHLGNDALAGMALVFPPVMLMQMVSAGAMGGGISSAIARALGRGARGEADALVRHAVVINVGLGLACSAVMIAFGRPVYSAMGGEGAALEAALVYSHVVFAGMPLLWLMNGLASVVRGTGNMLMPALVICVGVALLVPASPLLIFGLGPLPGLGVAGAGAALVAFYVGGAVVLAWYVLAGWAGVHLRMGPISARPLREILRIGAVATVSSVQTNITIAVSTALVATTAGTDAVAGFGTGARLEYLLIPLVFGVGAPLVALVGTNIGAGQYERALRIAMIGGAVAFVMAEIVGLAAALFPAAWLGLFSTDPATIETGSAYLRIVGPFYGFFGLGMALYFASQGAGKLFWPLTSGFTRMVIALGGGWIALALTGSLNGLFAALSVALAAYGLMITAAVRAGAWYR